MARRSRDPGSTIRQLSKEAHARQNGRSAVLHRLGAAFLKREATTPSSIDLAHTQVNGQMWLEVRIVRCDLLYNLVFPLSILGARIAF